MELSRVHGSSPVEWSLAGLIWFDGIFCWGEAWNMWLSESEGGEENTVCYLLCRGVFCVKTVINLRGCMMVVLFFFLFQGQSCFYCHVGLSIS